MAKRLLRRRLPTIMRWRSILKKVDAINMIAQIGVSMGTVVWKEAAWRETDEPGDGLRRADSKWQHVCGHLTRYHSCSISTEEGL